MNLRDEEKEEKEVVMWNGRSGERIGGDGRKGEIRRDYIVGFGYFNKSDWEEKRWYVSSKKFKDILIKLI